MKDLNETKVVPTEKMEEGNTITTKKFNIEKTCLKHILVAMAISGCYNPNKRKSCSRFFTIYRILIFLTLLAFVAKTASGFAYISKTEYFGHAIVLGWNICSTVMFLLSLKMNHSVVSNQDHTFEFLNTTVLPQMADLGIKFDNVSFKRKQIVLCLVAAVIIILVVLFSILQLSGIFGGGNTATMTTPFERTPLTSFVQILLLVVCSLPVTIPTFYMIVICCMLTQCFSSFNQYLDAEMSHDACRMPQTMQTLRQYYTNLCKAVVDFDKDFRYLLGNLFFWNIILSLLTLYVTLRVDMGNNGTIGIMTYIFWLLLCMGTLVATSVFAALVNEAAHAPLDSIYYINVQDITVEKLAQLNLFLSKLTGTQVGFSTCGLLIITKEFILTIAGVFLTYFAVLYTL
ncbi:uncharacterized protein LOC123540846 isoform X2 [Mercenaria mercenaria]|uniref:uncharacterized protein LOC123540846 isoform X2 n=1 Tax=Mercenaria mercenaria TaxID=6596 RepID=UPI00234F78B7|nr:uncharacterized protein LOC123540846 isoform X2 [Mercenaria mercenaria]